MLIYDILLKYNTDKNEGVLHPSSNGVGHTYGKSYDKIFESFNKKALINLISFYIQSCYHSILLY